MVARARHRFEVALVLVVAVVLGLGSAAWSRPLCCLGAVLGLASAGESCCATSPSNATASQGQTTPPVHGRSCCGCAQRAATSVVGTDAGAVCGFAVASEQVDGVMVATSHDGSRCTCPGRWWVATGPGEARTGMERFSVAVDGSLMIAALLGWNRVADQAAAPPRRPHARAPHSAIGDGTTVAPLRI